MPQQRGFDGHRVRPPHVMRAVLTDDKPMLSELGKRGAANRQRRAAKKKVHGDSNNAKIEGLIASMHTVEQDSTLPEACSSPTSAHAEAGKDACKGFYGTSTKAHPRRGVSTPRRGSKRTYLSHRLIGQIYTAQNFTFWAVFVLTILLL